MNNFYSRAFLFIQQLSLVIILVIIGILPSCQVDDPPKPDPSDKLAIDSLVAAKTDIKIWEKINIIAYTRGENLTFSWSANHGSMADKDSSTVTYWACPSCVGNNTIKCTVTNEYGSVSDTIMVNVHF